MPSPTKAPAPAAVPSIDETDGVELPRAEDPVVLPKPTDEELTDLRTDGSRTFDVGNGQLTTEFFSEQTYYKPSGSEDYQPIDLGFRGSADGAYLVDKSPVTVRVGAADDPAGVLTVSDADFSVA